jgi:ketosteroid isomerase-like protein
MSQENVEVVRRLYPGTVDLVAQLADPGRFEGLRAVLDSLVHPDFETVAVAGQVPLSQAGAGMPEGSSRPTYYGVEGFVAAFRDWLSAWESWMVTATDFIEVDENRVLVPLDVRARSKTHQVEMPIEGANLVTLRDGRLTRLELFFDRAQALEAAGLGD